MQHYIDVIVARETSCVLLFCSITKSAYDTVISTTVIFRAEK